MSLFHGKQVEGTFMCLRLFLKYICDFYFGYSHLIQFFKQDQKREIAELKVPILLDLCFVSLTYL